MLIIYRLLINLIFLISPLIIIFRLIKKKEDFFRFQEKFCFFTKKRKIGKLIWFHGASVGELRSIVPLIERFEKNKKINQILITSNTLSSSKIIKKIRFKKVVHQFFPIDTNFLTKKFLKYWNPSLAFFIDSEIWPNMVLNLYTKNVPITLLNGRITNKTYNRWQKIPSTSKKIFGKFNLCLSSSQRTENYLKKLGVKNVKFFGNLKFSQSEKEKNYIDRDLKNFIKSKKAWCASSTHETEEMISGRVHLNLKKRYKNLLTIIIPRHVERSSLIENELCNLGLKIHRHEPKTKIKKNTDIYLVNSYGHTKAFYSVCKNVFLGGSIVKHGGQNPLEATRYGCNILHGPNVSNFSEIFDFLKRNNISTKIFNEKSMSKELVKLLSTKKNSKLLQRKLEYIGRKILQNTYKEIHLLYKNEI
tara:strand:+ start:7304 stop:8557 length:1254 start_codon:yes stop_codon:yes gene_type:complete